MKARILLVDDHRMFRAGVKAVLAGEPGLEVIGEASSAEDAVAETLRLEPDVVLMDLGLGASDGLEATRRIVALGLEPRVLVLTSHDVREYLVPVIEAGASGLLSKSATEHDLARAIAVVAAGDVFLPPGAARLLVDAFRGSRTVEVEVLHGLEIREQEVLALTASGFSAREIGEKLFMSTRTVETYRTGLMKRLGFEHRSELVRFALKAGLLSRL